MGTQKGVEPPPQFSAHVYCDKTAAWIKMPLGTEVGLGPDDIVLDGDPAPPPLKGHSPHFWPLSVVAKRLDGLIKLPLGMEICLGPGDFVFDGDPATPRKKGTPIQFLAHIYCGQTAGWMKTPLCTEIDLSTGHIVLDVVPAVRERGTAAPPLFVHVYCGHGRLSQLLLSSFSFFLPCACVFCVFHLGLYYHYVMNKDVQKVPLMRFH